ncbi:hypothetical protein [Mesorhizobium sp.]|uniref:hypothetical protein n=1 Tax=Mesorhizobium sp. TaxID=1871066 RepID=UPI00338EECA3
MRYCRESGIAIPGQLSITGFDDILAAEFFSPRCRPSPSQDWKWAAPPPSCCSIGGGCVPSRRPPRIFRPRCVSEILLPGLHPDRT